MRPGVITALRRIKGFRMNRAETEWSKSQLLLRSAQDKARVEHDRLAEYRQQMPGLEAAIVGTVLGRLVSPRDLTDMRAKLQALRDHERALVETLDAAAAKARAVEQAANDAQARREDARRNLRKYDQLATILDRKARQAAERREEAELEDVRSANGRRVESRK